MLCSMCNRSIFSISYTVDVCSEACFRGLLKRINKNLTNNRLVYNL